MFKSVNYLDGDREETDEITRPGKVKIVFQNGDTFEGNYIENSDGDGLVRSGHGVYVWMSGGKYEGNYDNGRRNGQGKYDFPNGERYEGSWQNNVKSGSGLYTYSNGDEFRGNWAGDKRNGPGTFTNKAEKLEVSGQWKDGKLVPSSVQKKYVGPPKEEKEAKADPPAVEEEPKQKVETTPVEAPTATETKETDQNQPEEEKPKATEDKAPEEEKPKASEDKAPEEEQPKAAEEKAPEEEKQVEKEIPKAGEEKTPGEEKQVEKEEATTKEAEGETKKDSEGTKEVEKEATKEEAVEEKKETNENSVVEKKEEEKPVEQDKDVAVLDQEEAKAEDGASKENKEAVTVAPPSGEEKAKEEELPHIPLAVIISGAPASGKGTQCAKIKEKYGLVHISTGDLLREEVASGSELGKELDAVMKAGGLVETSLVNAALKRKIIAERKDVERSGILLDGYPRAPDQAQALTDLGIKIDMFIVLQVADEVVINRLGGRRVHKETKVVKNLSDIPVEERDNYEIRKDDTPEALTKRLEQYRKNVGSIEEYYKEQIVRVDGDRPVEDVWSEIHGKMEGMLKTKE